MYNLKTTKFKSHTAASTFSQAIFHLESFVNANRPAGETFKNRSIIIEMDHEGGTRVQDRF